MPDEVQDANVEDSSSPELTEALEGSVPSTEQQSPDTQTPTAQQGESQEQEEEQPVAEEQVPLHEQPRFKEVVDEKNWYRKQLESQMQHQQTQQQFQQPQAPDPYANLTPEEQRWYRDRDARVEQIAAKKVEQYIQQRVAPQLEAGRRELARMTVTDFRRAHPDIKANSPDELTIAEKISTGYQPEDAYWSVMGPRGVQRAESKVKKQVKQSTEAKKRANVEHSSIPSAGIPKDTSKKTARQIAAENWDSYMGTDF